MKTIKKLNKLTLSTLLLTIASSSHLYAAAVIDSGSIQRDIENLNTPNLPPVPQPAPAEPTIPKSDSNISVKVTAFQFVGATLLADALLQAEVQSILVKL